MVGEDAASRREGPIGSWDGKSRCSVSAISVFFNASLAVNVSVTNMSDHPHAYPIYPELPRALPPFPTAAYYFGLTAPNMQ
jgi:hypothetical protein